MLRFPMTDLLVCGAVRHFATLRIIHEMTRTVGHFFLVGLSDVRANNLPSSRPPSTAGPAQAAGD
jgi:hypothetical protein